MEIGKIMQRLNESRTAEQTGIKTASAASPVTANSDVLRNALRDTLAAAPLTEKTASVAPQDNPVGDLLKLAEDLTSAEEEALLKQASLYGTAMCDGFMTRLAQYENAAQAVASDAPKTAAYLPYTTQDADLETIKMAAANDVEFHKFANANPDLVKEAVDLGYRQTWDALVKQADDEFQQGYDDTMRETHKLAADCYKTGALTINHVLRQLQAA